MILFFVDGNVLFNANGYPVAFDANALLRLEHALTSITQNWSLDGPITPKWRTILSSALRYKKYSWFVNIITYIFKSIFHENELPKFKSEICIWK